MGWFDEKKLPGFAKLGSAKMAACVIIQQISVLIKTMVTGQNFTGLKNPVHTVHALGNDFIEKDWARNLFSSQSGEELCD